MEEGESRLGLFLRARFDASFFSSRLLSSRRADLVFLDNRTPQMMSHMAIQPSLVQDWFEPFRANALQSLGAPLVDDGPKKPVVVYLDRNRNVSRPSSSPFTSQSTRTHPHFGRLFRLAESIPSLQPRESHRSHQSPQVHLGESRGSPVGSDEHEEGGDC